MSITNSVLKNKKENNIILNKPLDLTPSAGSSFLSISFIFFIYLFF